MGERRCFRSPLVRAAACLLLVATLAGICWAATGSWSTGGPVTRTLVDRVVYSVAISSDGNTVYAGFGNGSVFSHSLGLIAPTASFTASPRSGNISLTVRFNDTSSSSPTKWNWSFGDGTWFNTTLASARNASHTYMNAGSYTVNLTAANALGSDTHSETGYITVTLAAPSVTTVIPATGLNTSTVTTTISGSGFNTSITSGTTVNLTRTGYANISATGITPSSTTSISVTLPITHAEAGTWYLVVVNPDGQESTESIPFRITDPEVLQPPSVLSLSRATGINTGSVSTVITGTGFNTTMSGGTTVNLTRSGAATISVTGLTASSETRISVSLPITGAEAGTWYLVVVNPDGQESVEHVAFTITSPAPTTVPTTSVPTTTTEPVPPPANPAGSDDSGSSVLTQVSHPSTTVAVNIGGNSQIGRATVTGTGLKDLIVTGTVLSGPGRATTTPPATVFQYVSLLPARYTTVTGAVLDFSVPQSWLDENHIAPENVALYRYAGGTWTALPTMVTKTGNGRISLAATSPGFSLFAIAGTAGSPTVSPPDNVQPSGANPGTGITTGTAEQILTELLQSGDPGSENSLAARTGPDAGFPPATITVIAAGIALLIGAGWYIRRWWRYRQNPALFKEYD